MQPINTSVTLLNAIANNTETVRWTEFFTKYEPMMRVFLASHFPSLDHDDIIQESMRALIKKLPGYTYTPDKNGHFKAYLTGIVKYKALDQLKKSKRIKTLEKRCADDSVTAACDIPEKEEAEWKMQTMEAAIEQLLADESINPRNREIFRHTALLHEPPEAVAVMFGISRGNVDVIKKRMIAKLSAMVNEMTRLS
jgi:RNA polymerase sigma factor (sigma-70 family)